MAGLLDYLFLNGGGQGGGGLLGNFNQQQNLPDSYDMQAPNPGMLGSIGGGIDRFGQAMQSATDNPLLHMGLGLASGRNPQESFGNALAAMRAQKKDADTKDISAHLARALGVQFGGNQGAPGQSAAIPQAPPAAPATQPPGGPAPLPQRPAPLAPVANTAGPEGPRFSTGGGSAFGGLPGWAPGERPMEGGIPDGLTAHNPQTGQRLIRRNNQWMPQ